MLSANNLVSLSKTLGYTKPKTYQFRKIKEDHANKKQRFKKKPVNPLYENNSSPTVLLNGSNTSTEIELGGLGGSIVPPWVDVYEEGQEKLKKVKDIHREIQKLIAAKLKDQFGNHNDIDAQIDRKNNTCTTLLQQCEAHLSTITNMGKPDETISQQKIRKNIEKSLATQIQEVAVLLRKQQKGLLDKVKHLNGTSATSELNVESSEDPYSEDLQEMIEVEDIARERDEGINKLIDNINKLSHLFKDMNQIVLEQGTIVDRIDYNLEQAGTNTFKAKKELAQADKAMNSKCGAYCIRMLVLLNIIFSFLLVMKYSHKK